MNQSQSSYLIPDDDDNPFAGINVNYESMPDWAGEDVPLSAYEGEYIPDMAEEGHYSDGPASASAQMGRFTSTRKPTIAPPTFAPKFGAKPIPTQQPAQRSTASQPASVSVSASSKPGFSAPPIFQTGKPIPNRDEAKQVQAPVSAATSTQSRLVPPTVGAKPVGAKPTFVFNPAGFKPNASQPKPAARPIVTNQPATQSQQEDDDDQFETMVQPQFTFSRPRG